MCNIEDKQWCTHKPHTYEEKLISHSIDMGKFPTFNLYIKMQWLLYSYHIHISLDHMIAATPPVHLALSHHLHMSAIKVNKLSTHTFFTYSYIHNI